MRSPSTGCHRPIVVAIDGPAGAGKSTVAQRLARRLGFLYIDTGAMYRAVALEALRQGLDLEDEQRLAQLARSCRLQLAYPPLRVSCNGRDVTLEIRTPEVSEAASRISALPAVRRALVEAQRAMARHQPVVMEGRDIGTVVFPDAQIKVYLDASPEIRAERRKKELEQRGQPVAAEQLLKEILERDWRDMNRADSPLRRAPDAVYVDSSGMTIEEVEQTILKLVHSWISNCQQEGDQP